jgi:hypothetical protein
MKYVKLFEAFLNERPMPNAHTEAENILDSVPQIIWKYPRSDKGPDAEKINIVHIHASDSGFHIAFKATPYDIDWIGYKELDSLEAAIAEFNKKGYGEIVKKYGSKNADDSAEELFKKLVPGSGHSDTIEGELLRAIFKLEYRWGNDGDMISKKGGYLDSIKAPFMFLKAFSESDDFGKDLGISDALESLEEVTDPREYSAYLDDIKGRICKLIILKGDKLTPNTRNEDMYSDEFVKKADEYFKIENN